MNELFGNIAINFLLFCYVTYVVLINRRYFHMLQLNSYVNSRLIGWFSSNFRKELIPFSYLIGNKKVEKKQFIFTNRIWRMYFTLSFIMAIIVLYIEYLLVVGASYTMLLAIFALLLIIAESKIVYVLLINTINFPFEKLIGKWYIFDARRILQRHKNLVIIGITGSYGKTSSKYILTRFLSEKYNVLMTPESYNTLLGVVRTIREQLRPIHEVFVVEMGAKNIGDIKEIAEFVKPTYGLLTSVGMQHLETFKSFENIVKTKFELVDSLPENGIAFLNFDNKAIKEKKINKNFISYGIENDLLHYRASNIFYDENGLRFLINSYRGDTIEINTRLLGLHNVMNILGAVAVASEMGVDYRQIQFAAKQLSPIPHRLELKKHSQDLIVIDDAFNSNPEGAGEAIHVLDKFEGRKKILVTPGMVELGEKEFQLNFEFGINCAKVCDFIILVGKTRAIPILKGLRNANYDEEKVYVASNLNDALAKLKTITNGECVVLFENDLPDNYDS